MNNYNKIIIAGGTGYLGNVLVNHFKKNCDHIYILSRSKKQSYENVHFLTWDAKTIGLWANHLEGADVLINLTGKSVDCRYNEANKKLIISSRVDATKVLGEAIKQCDNPPKVWMNASSATIYKHSLDKQMDEETGVIGSGFSVDVVKAWEASFFKFKTKKTRQVTLRITIVLGKNSMAIKPLKNLTRIGFGGKQGAGNQIFSWIHDYDFANCVTFIIDNPTLEGPINIAAPNPSTNKKLMKLFQKHLNIPFGIPISEFLLEVGARLIKTETELILKSRNVIPKKLIQTGFIFKYNTLDKALQNILKK